MSNKFNQYLYYFIIAFVSVLSIAIFPLLGSDMDLVVAFPTTTAGWIIYVGSALAVAAVNIMIFYGFLEQGRLNVHNDPHYVEATEILLKLSLKHPKKTKLPRSPKKWNTVQYSRKGVCIFLSSIFSCFAFTNAILRFDLITLLTYSFTIVFAIIFGIFQMKTAESYWTDEYYRYAKYEENKEDSDKND